jgi:hypothetical protein
MMTFTMLRGILLGAIAAVALLVAGMTLLAKAQAGSDQPAAPPRQACAADVERLCAGVPHGSGRLRRCMIDKNDQVSDGCKSAMAAARSMSTKR